MPYEMALNFRSEIDSRRALNGGGNEMSNETTRLTTPVFKYPLNLQLFADDPAEPEPNPEPTEPVEPQPEPKLVPQDEVDRIVADRLARERKKYADYDDIKAKLAAAEQAEEERKRAEMSELERLQAEKEAAEKAAAEAQEARDKALAAANQRLIKAEFMTIARELKVRADALEDAYKLADLSSVNVSEDGGVTGAKEAADALIAGKPYLLEPEKAQPKPIGDSRPNAADEERKTLEMQLADARKAKDFGKVVELSNKIKNL